MSIIAAVLLMLVSLALAVKIIIMCIELSKYDD